MDAPVPSDDALATLTHARLRASQGDYRAARELLGRFLDRHPASEAARQLLQSLEVAEAGGRPLDAETRIARLRSWLARIRRNAGAPAGL